MSYCNDLLQQLQIVVAKNGYGYIIFQSLHRLVAKYPFWASLPQNSYPALHKKISIKQRDALLM